MKPKGKIKRTIIAAVISIAALCAAGGIVMGVQLSQMNKQNATACSTSYGQKRLDELKNQGFSVARTVYSDEEIKADPAKASVKLYCFPNPQKQKSRFVLVCPGGAYSECAVSVEGYPPAAQLNELGYTAFVLEYRVGKNGGDFAAVDDLAAAVAYITERADEFNVERENYALLGFSAGGNLVGLFGTEKNGYGKYGVQKPSVIFMGYPWCNQNIKSINPARIIMYSILNSRGYNGLIGKGATAREKQQMRIPPQVTESYPPCYIMHGTKDVIVPGKTHSDVLAEALENNGILFSYEKAEGVNHGCGIGKGTSAENWLLRAVAFWENEIQIMEK